MKTIKFLTLLSIATVFILSGCSLFQRFSQEVNNISKLQFKLDQVNNFTLNSVKLSNISKVSDISAMDIMSLTKAISNKYLPVNFTLNVIASNPNKVTSRTSTSNDANNTSNFDAIIENISWVLYIDNVETVNGIVSTPIKVPNNSSSTIIPVNINLDLYKFFGDKGLENIINMALAIGGVKGSSSRLALKAKPTIKIGGFSIPYPNYITIVNTEFRDK